MKHSAKIMSGEEARRLLTEQGIKLPEEGIAKNAEEALETANRIGYPVALKLISPEIISRSSADAIILNISSDRELIEGYKKIIKNAKKYKENANIFGVLVQKQIPQGKEVIVGMVRDPRVGPAVMFGLGGVFTNVLKDLSFRTAPVSKSEALEMIKEIKFFEILKGGKESSDIDAIADVIVKVSKLGIEKREIREIEIDPLFVYEKGAIAVDFKMISD